MEENYCIACQYGQHDEHIDYPEIPSPGVMGGWHCPCKGECVEYQAKKDLEGSQSHNPSSDLCSAHSRGGSMVYMDRVST